jgi:hypothetical protein
MEGPLMVDIPSVPGTNREGRLRVEAMRKLGEILQTPARSKIFRDFFVCERSETSKKRTKRIRLKAGWSFYTASVQTV